MYAELVWRDLEQPGLHHSDGTICEDHEDTQSSAIKVWLQRFELSLDGLPAESGRIGVRAGFKATV